MLTEQDFVRIEKQAMQIYQNLELQIIEEIAKRIAKVGYANTVVLNNIQIAQEMGMLYQDIVLMVAKYNNVTYEEISKIFNEAGSTTLKFDDEIYIEAGLNPLPINQSSGMVQLLNSTIAKTAGNLQNLVLTTANTSQTQFYNAMNKAYMEVSAGVKTYSQSIIDAIGEISSQGAVITYPSGRRMSLESAVRMNVVTGVNQTCGKLQELRANELGWDLMEITAHSGARPEHATWQGKIVSRSGQKGYLSLKDIGYGTATGFKGINCRHDWYPYYKGSTRTYTDKQLKEWQEEKVTYNGQEISKYEATQIQRKLERQIRKDKKEIAGLEGVLTTDNKDSKLLEDTKAQLLNKQNKLKKDNSILNDFVEQTNSRKDYTRLYVGKNSKVGYLGTEANYKNKLTSTIIKKEKMENLSGRSKTNKLKQYEKQIVNKNVENAVVIDKEGQVYLIEGNSDDSIYVKNLGAEKLKDCYMTHNHPKNKTHYSLSAYDISEFMETGMQKLRGRDHKYTYEIEKTKSTKKADRDIILYEFNKKYRNKALEIIFNNNLDADEYEYHLINQMLAKKYHYKYRRVLNE